MDYCSDILSKGIFDEYSIKLDSDFKSSVKKIFSYSYDELHKMNESNSFEAGLSIALVKKLISIDGTYESSKETYDRLRLDFLNSSDEEISEQIALEIKKKVVSKDVVQAWSKCMVAKGGQTNGVNIEALGNVGTYAEPNVDFIVRIGYLPRAESDPREFYIKSVDVVGARIAGDYRFKEGAAIERYSGLAQKFQRQGVGPVTINVGIKGRDSVTLNLPQLEAPPAPPPPTPPAPITVDISEKTLGKWIPPHVKGDPDFDGKADIRLRARLELTESNTKLVARVYMLAAEPEADWTKAEGESSAADPEFLLYEAPAGHKIVEIVSPQQHADFLEYRDTNHETQKIDVKQLKDLISKLHGWPKTLLQNTFKFSDNGFVKVWEVVGDTKGGEAGTRTSVIVSLNKIQINILKD